jgi:RND family efflux transporter MFP subunit
MKHLHMSLILLCILLASCGDKQPEQSEDPVKPVRYAEVLTSGGQYTRTLTGTTQSADVVQLSFLMSGQIEKLDTKVGQEVSQGELLAKLDQSDIVLSHEQAKAALRSSEIQLETAKSSFERVKQLYQANNASLSDYENARNNYAASEANYESARNNLQLTESKFEYSRIVAPASGIIASVHAKVGEFAQAGKAVFVLNSGTGNIEVKVGMPERYIAQVKQNSPVTVTLNSMAGRAFSGTVTEVGYSAEGSTYPVIVRVDDSPEDMRPGMPADVEFVFGDAGGATKLIVPFKSVGEDTQGTFVFRLEPTDSGLYTAQKSYVQVGTLLPEGFEILDGVADGDLVATAGLKSLSDGRKVSLLER